MPWTFSRYSESCNELADMMKVCRAGFSSGLPIHVFELCRHMWRQEKLRKGCCANSGAVDFTWDFNSESELRLDDALSACRHLLEIRLIQRVALYL